MGLLRVQKQLVHGHIVGDVLVLGVDVVLDNLRILVTVGKCGVICKATNASTGITVDIEEAHRILVICMLMLRFMAVNNFRKLVSKNYIKQRA